MFGQTTLSPNSVVPTRVSADNNPLYKPGGITIDWSSITAVGADTTLTDGTVIRSGQKFIRYGQVLTKNTTGTVQTLTGTATGGTFTMSLVRPDNGATVTTAALSATATAAQILTALQAVLAPSQIVSTSGGALGTATVPITFGATFPALTINGGALTGGTVTVAQTTVGASAGLFGPYDPAASDGRQTLTRGECYIADETILQYDSGTAMISAQNDQTGRVIEGGLVFLDRIIQSGTVTGTLALGPTKANLLAAFPMLRIVEN